MSYAEIYNEKIIDLLNSSKDDLKIVKSKSKGFIIKDISEYMCSNKS